MKRRMLKTAGLLILLMLCVMLTGCYKDRDPWPASADVQTARDDAAFVTPTPPAVLPTAVQVIATTFEPVPATVAPVPRQEMHDFWADEPTRMPGGSVEPGTNG